MKNYAASSSPKTSDSLVHTSFHARKPKNQWSHRVEMARKWIEGDESAKEMLARLNLTEKPFSHLHPLRNLSLRVGNVVEIVGPSSSVKTDLLIQAAISCILPKNWNGIHYGGLEHLVMFIDLDCHFDVQRLSQSLKHKIIELNELKANTRRNQFDADDDYYYDKELFRVCMTRFLYVRCYDSFHFLATIKTMHNEVEKATKSHNAGVHLLLIDSIGAFYWSDRTAGSLPSGGRNRKSLSLQCVSEAVVDEIRQLLIVHPMLVLATKTTIASSTDKYSANGPKRAHFSHREFMPSAWQSFVTHRLLLRALDNEKNQNEPVYLSEWLLPSLNISERFVVTNGGIFTAL